MLLRFFFFNDTATTEIYTLSLHDALPIFGLVLAQIGEKADIKVTDDEVTQALVERVRQYPGQEREVWDYFRNNPQALAEIRAPLFEEKVVDHILSQVKVDEETVSKEALFGDEEAPTAEAADQA